MDKSDKTNFTFMFFLNLCFYQPMNQLVYLFLEPFDCVQTNE